MNLVTIVIVVAMLMTVGVLITGIGSMAHGGEFDRKHEGEFMFARVGMQLITILLLLFAVYLEST